MIDTRAGRSVRRWRWSRRGLVLGAIPLLLGVVIALGAVAAQVVGHRADASPVPLGAALDPAEPPAALVFVSGAVASPGVYRLPATDRVADAVAAAGGVTAVADQGHMPDLAARIHDGTHVNVPSTRSPVSGAGRVAPDGNPRLDLNTASLDELRAVPGMPVGLPEAILDKRSTLGPFRSISELRTMLGVDSTTITGIRPYLRAGNVTR